MTLADLPDDTPVWIDGYGESTLGEIRHQPEEVETLSDFERTVNMWCDIAACNLNRQPWEPELSYDQVRAYHAIREPWDPPQLFG